MKSDPDANKTSEIQLKGIKKMPRRRRRHPIEILSEMPLIGVDLGQSRLCGDFLTDNQCGVIPCPTGRRYMTKPHPVNTFPTDIPFKISTNIMKSDPDANKTSEIQLKGIKKMPRRRRRHPIEILSEMPLIGVDLGQSRLCGDFLTDNQCGVIPCPTGRRYMTKPHPVNTFPTDIPFKISTNI
ncbi:hypothetical protein P9112_005397 [Eukaryota sp. TZLM1-RC]